MSEDRGERVRRPRGRKPTYGVVELTDGFLKPDVRFL